MRSKLVVIKEETVIVISCHTSMVPGLPARIIKPKTSLARHSAMVPYCDVPRVIRHTLQMDPLVNFFVSKFALRDCREILRTCELTAMPSVDIALAVSKHG